MGIKEITCISDLYYVIGRWFTLGMFVVAFVTLPFALEAWDSVWSFLMCGGIAFVGCAGDYKHAEHDVHYVSALASAVCAFVWVGNVCPLVLCLMGTMSMAYLDRRRWLLWCELPFILMVYSTLILRLCYDK